MWKCSKCGEESGDDFEVCWKCGTSIDGKEDPNFFNEEDKEPSLQPYGDVAAQTETSSQERLLTVTTCSLPAEAHAIRIQLEAASIPVLLADEFTVSMDWLLANAVGGIKVQVTESNYLKACEILGLNDQGDEEQPESKSADDEGDDAKDEEEYKW